KIAGGPFPDVTEHLPAAEGAIAGDMGGDVGGMQYPGIELRLLRRGSAVAPRERAFARRQPPTVWFTRGGRFPLRLAGQAASSPAAVRVSLIPVHVQHGAVGFQRHPGVKITALPRRGTAPPVDG